MSDDGYAGEELREDVREMLPVLAVIYHFFSRHSSLDHEDAVIESMMDGLGYIYFCRKNWHKSSLLKSLDPDLRRVVHSRMAGQAIEQFLQVAEEPLTSVVRAFVRQRRAAIDN